MDVKEMSGTEMGQQAWNPSTKNMCVWVKNLGESMHERPEQN